MTPNLTTILCIQPLAAHVCGYIIDLTIVPSPADINIWWSTQEKLTSECDTGHKAFLKQFVSLLNLAKTCTTYHAIITTQHNYNNANDAALLCKHHLIHDYFTYFGNYYRAPVQTVYRLQPNTHHGTALRIGEEIASRSYKNKLFHPYIACYDCYDLKEASAYKPPMAPVNFDIHQTFLCQDCGRLGQHFKTRFEDHRAQQLYIENCQKDPKLALQYEVFVCLCEHSNRAEPWEMIHDLVQLKTRGICLDPDCTIDEITYSKLRAYRAALEQHHTPKLPTNIEWDEHIHSCNQEQLDDEINYSKGLTEALAEPPESVQRTTFELVQLFNELITDHERYCETWQIDEYERSQDLHNLVASYEYYEELSAMKASGQHNPTWEPNEYADDENSNSLVGEYDEEDYCNLIAAELMDQHHTSSNSILTRARRDHSWTPYSAERDEDDRKMPAKQLRKNHQGDDDDRKMPARQQLKRNPYHINSENVNDNNRNSKRQRQNYACCK